MFEPRGSVLGDLHPPRLTVCLEVVALAFQQATVYPGTDDVQRHAETLGHSRDGVASIRVPVGKALAPRPVGRDPVLALSLGRDPPEGWSQTGSLVN